MVQFVGDLLVAHNVALREAFAHHAVVEVEIETALLDERHRQVVQVNLTEGPDEQAQQTDGARGFLVGKHLIEEQQVGAQHAGAVAVDDALDAVSRGLQKIHGAVAVDIEDHAQETVDEQMVLQPAVAAGSVRLGGAGQKVASFHIRVLKETVVHFLTDVSVESFIHINCVLGVYLGNVT